ncbi:MAG: hypothetical protein EBU01_15020 [Crocinitomicaceae bacterium]|nr:hypothetical protein [Crocinitomicaceae bacterium]
MMFRVRKNDIFGRNQPVQIVTTSAEIADLIAAHPIQLKFTLVNLSDYHLRRGLFTFFGGGPKTQELKTELNAMASR